MRKLLQRGLEAYEAEEKAAGRLAKAERDYDERDRAVVAGSNPATTDRAATTKAVPAAVAVPTAPVTAVPAQPTAAPGAKLTPAARAARIKELEKQQEFYRKQLRENAQRIIEEQQESLRGTSHTQAEIMERLGPVEEELATLREEQRLTALREV